MGAKENELQENLQAWISREQGGRLMRNNSGVATYPDGSKVQYGVGSPGGSDLIGFTVVEITPDMVGRRVAVFTAVEAKSGSKKPTEKQEAFLALVRRKGGIAAWGNTLEPIRQAIVNWRPPRERAQE